jgi:hypothetical protein
MKKIISLYPIFALLILLTSIVYAPTIQCDTYKGDTQCYDGGYRFFTELRKNQDDNHNYEVVSLKTDVYVIQIIATLLALLGAHTILTRKKLI